MYRMKDRTKWTRGEPEAQEIQKAIVFWIQYAQMRTDKKEIELLKQKDDNKAWAKSTITKLQPVLDEKDMLRVGGRIEKALVPFDMRHPVIVPPKSRLSYLLVQEAHHDTMHGS